MNNLTKAENKIFLFINNVHFPVDNRLSIATPQIAEYKYQSYFSQENTYFSLK
jgi:hypothetical protein